MSFKHINECCYTHRRKMCLRVRWQLDWASWGEGIVQRPAPLSWVPEPWPRSAGPEHPDPRSSEWGELGVAGGIWFLGNERDWRDQDFGYEQRRTRDPDRVGTRRLNPDSAQMQGQEVLVEVGQGIGWAH